MTERIWPLRGATVVGSAAGRAFRMPVLGPAVDAHATLPATRIRSALWVVVPGAVIGGLIIAGTAIGSGSVALIGAGLALVAAVVVPEVGLAVLAMLAPLLPPPGIPAPGLNLMLVGALLLGCIYRLPVDRPYLRLSKSVLFLLGFVIYISAQQLPDLLGGYAGDAGHQIGYLFFQVLAGFGLVLAAGYILRGRSPIPILTMALLGASVAAIVAILTFDVDVSGSPLVRLVATADVGLRAAGPFVNPNYMGMFSAVVLVGIMAMWDGASSRLGRTLLIVVAILCAVSVVQAQSRGAMIAGFAGVAAIVWMKNRAAAAAVAGAGLVAAILIYPAFVEWRLTNLRGDVTDAGYVAMFESDDARLNASLAGPAMFLAEPIFGVGFGQFVAKSVTISGLDTGINAHNWYVNVLAEQGTTGGLLWLGATVAAGAELRSRRGVGRTVGVGVFTTLVLGFVFLEGPDSFQLIAIPALFLIAALVSDWGSWRTDERGTGTTVESTGALA